jgi:SpoVK/Ycf46/Vps4 family AAA+-type ATPase
VARSFSARLDAAALLGPLGALRASGLLVLDPEDSLTGRLTPEPALAAWVLGLPIAERRATSDFPARPLTTVHTMADVVLAPRTRARLAQLQDRVRLRGRVVDEWGFGRHHDNSSGLVALFHGPPGTGKTMTAGAIAGAAGLPAYMIDLSALVSKYIGETEKALAKVFDRAAREQCVLVFDEADAIFGTRTEVSDSHDRYANQEVSYLLTRVESHPGVVILTTNLVGNIDEAFRRRIHIDVEFSAPGPTERAAIWTAALPPALPTSGDLGLEDLADRFAITGAQIRDAIIDAAYAAAARDEAVTRDHLVAAVRQQYDKAGRTVPA